MTKTSKPGVSRRSTLALMGAGAVTFATPWVARAQAKTIKVGMPTILSGRVAQLGTSSRNAKAKGLKRWATCSPDYAYGRDTTGEFVYYLKQFAPDVEIVSDAWPKLFQPDYTEVVTKILQAKPQALFSALWGGDLTSYIDQPNIYAMFSQMEVFAVNMADYTALTVVKNLPKGIHSGNRYIKTYPATAENAAWGDAYKAKFNEYPTNWSWENATAIMLLAEASKKANSADGKKIADAMRGLTIKSPFGADGTVTMRAEDQTLIGYAIGWGTTIPQEPYVPEVQAGDWKTILELEAEWKKSKGYA